MTNGDLVPDDGETPPSPPQGAPGERLVPGDHPLAEPWTRIGARVIDGLILLAVSFALAAALVDADEVGTSVDVGFLVLSLLIGAGYEIGFVGAKGGTPGKLLLGLRVITQEHGTTPPGWDKAGLRYLPTLAGLVPVLGGIISLAIAVVSLVWLFSDDRRRTVYDRVATTYVVKV